MADFLICSESFHQSFHWSKHYTGRCGKDCGILTAVPDFVNRHPCRYLRSSDLASERKWNLSRLHNNSNCSRYVPSDHDLHLRHLVSPLEQEFTHRFKRLHPWLLGFQLMVADWVSCFGLLSDCKYDFPGFEELLQAKDCAEQPKTQVNCWIRFHWSKTSGNWDLYFLYNTICL